MLGRTALRPRRMARDPQRRGSTAWPGQRQDGLRRLLSGLDDPLREDGAEEAFFAPLWGRGRMPHRVQGLAEAEERLALLLTERDGTLLQRCEGRRSVLHPFQRLMPALLEFTGY